MKRVVFIFIFLASYLMVQSQLVEDFEVISMNLILGGSDDLSELSVVQNPYPDEINNSSMVGKYLRDKDGVSGGGFWSTLINPLNLTDNKYLHIKVWKTRISPIKFRFEGGPSGTLEIESMYSQSKTFGWEELVFDFSSLSGEYTGIALMPDYEDPLTLTEDIEIYFDDIVLNNESFVKMNVTFNVDMTEPISTLEFFEGQDKLFVTGSFDGWSMPGTNEYFELFESGTPNIYSMNAMIAPANYQYKYFMLENGIPSWDHGEWMGDPNREFTLTDQDLVLNDIWGEVPFKQNKSNLKEKSDCMIENFEISDFTLFVGGADDQSSWALVQNPNPEGINTSGYVIQYNRDKDGLTYGGFLFDTLVDLTTNKYIHVKVQKPRISSLKFGVFIGNSSNLEVFSTNEQTLTGEWEDMVFDFSEKTGTWSKFVFRPDYEDPLTLTEDIVIYFDDIIVNNDPNPITIGINEILEKNSVRIFPNPCQDFLTYTLPYEIQEVSVTNLTGQQQNFLFMTGQKNEGINVSNLSPGIYFIRLIDNFGNTYVQKFIKGI